MSGPPQRRSPAEFRRRAKARLCYVLELSGLFHPRFLLADVLADCSSSKADRGDSVTAGPRRCRREIPLLTQSRQFAIALFPSKNPITEATGAWGDRDAHMHMAGIRCPSDNLTFLLPGQRMGKSVPMTARLPEY